MHDFTPLPALLGGALIGLSAVVVLLLFGRVAGISGMVGGLIGRERLGLGLRVGFLLGLVSAGVGLLFASPEVLRSPPPIPLWGVGLAGLFVGFGTRLGSGCTSGHGVCGIGRFSLRSLVATCTFVGVGALTVFVLRHAGVSGTP